MSTSRHEGHEDHEDHEGQADLAAACGGPAICGCLRPDKTELNNRPGSCRSRATTDRSPAKPGQPDQPVFMSFMSFMFFMSAFGQAAASGNLLIQSPERIPE
jgi:hypothetical protein